MHLFQQPCMIALTTIFGQCDSIFYFGYHKGDDFFAESHNILSGSQWLLISLGNKNIKFSFPLRYMTKDIVRSIKKNHHKNKKNDTKKKLRKNKNYLLERCF